MNIDILKKTKKCRKVLRISKKSSTFAASKVTKGRYMEDVVQRFISECQKNIGVEMSKEDIQAEVNIVRKGSYERSIDDIKHCRIEKFSSADERCKFLGI